MNDSATAAAAPRKRKPGQAFEQVPTLKLIDLSQDDDVDMAVLDDTHDETKAAEMAYDRKQIVEYLKKEEEAEEATAAANGGGAVKRRRKKTQLPTVLEMAGELGVDWIGAIDPGSTNGSICVYSARQAQIVYWRVFALYELCVLCEKRGGIAMCASEAVRDELLARDEPYTEKERKELEKQRNDLYNHDQRIYAIGWWCQQDFCPLKRCDMVVIERQSFDINMKAIEAAWVTAFVDHKPAVVAPCKMNYGRNEYTIKLTKAYVLGAESVKAHFRGFFPLVADEHVAEHTAAAAAAAASKGKAAPRKQKRSDKRFVSRPRTYQNTEENRCSPQYAANKLNAKKWCRVIVGADVDMNSGRLKSRGVHNAASESAREDFKAAACDLYNTMSESEVQQTLQRLSGMKADDLADVLFMALYAAEVLVPSAWKRIHGPLVNTYNSVWKLYHTPTASQELLDPEAKHQSLFAYCKERAEVGDIRIDVLRNALK